MGCPTFAPLAKSATEANLEVVYSTTYAEIGDYAVAQFGEGGWVDCPACVCMSER